MFIRWLKVGVRSEKGDMGHSKDRRMVSIKGDWARKRKDTSKHAKGADELNASEGQGTW